MKSLQCFICAATVAGILPGCSGANDLAEAPDWTSPRVLTDEEYARASSLASTPQERAAVETARRVDGTRDQQRIDAESVSQMRQVLIESRTPEVRATVATGLGNAREFDSTPALLDAMGDESLLVRKAAAAAVQRMLGWTKDFPADGPIEQRQEVIAEYRDIWARFQDSNLYKVWKDPDLKEKIKATAQRKVTAERRRERHPRNQPKEKDSSNPTK